MKIVKNAVETVNNSTKVVKINVNQTFSEPRFNITETISFLEKISVVSVSINKILHTAASTAIIFKMIEIIFRFGFKTNANFGRPSDSKLMSIFLVRYSS